MADADNRADELLSRIGEDLLEAKFPLRAYNDPAIFDREMEQLFGTHWIFIGHESEVADPGDYIRRDIGTDPFILVRDESGDLNVFFNSCPHRGTQFCKSEYGNTSHFRCPYHGWTFNNGGDLVGVPHREQAYADDELADLDLVSAPHVDSYRGLVFACLAEDAPSLEAYLGDATWYLDLHFGLIDMEVHGQPERWELAVDWKNAVDNEVGDSYHADYGHKSAKDVGVGSSAIGAENADFSRRHVYDCDKSTHNFSVTDADTDVFWDHPPEVVETFNEDAVSADQLALARRTQRSLHFLFPNVQLGQLGQRSTPSKAPVGTGIIRIFQPTGPGRMEMIHLHLVPKHAPEEYKQRSLDTALSTFGVTGTVASDDVAIWDGIAEAGGTQFADRHHVTGDYRMGVDTSQLPAVELSPAAAATEVADWPGPGIAYREAKFSDVNQVEFQRNWYEALVD